MRILLNAGAAKGILTVAVTLVALAGPVVANHDASWNMQSQSYNVNNEDVAKSCQNNYMVGVPPSGRQCSNTALGDKELGLFGCGLAPAHPEASGVFHGEVFDGTTSELKWTCTATAGDVDSVTKNADDGGNSLNTLKGCFDPTGCAIDIGGFLADDAGIPWEVFVKVSD
jgi:hypothetical protein